MSDGAGLLQVYTGVGKGKTTAALGLALRAAGAGLRTAIVFFDKGGDDYSERKALAGRFAETIDFWATGLDRRDRETGGFRLGVTEDDKAEAARGLALAKAALSSGRYALVILDEINPTAASGMADVSDVLVAVRERAPGTEVVLTGRSAPSAFIVAADLVSRIEDDKHYLKRGIAARRGLDY